LIFGRDNQQTWAVALQISALGAKADITVTLTLRPGDVVSFDVGSDRAGRARAIDVKVVDV